MVDTEQSNYKTCRLSTKNESQLASSRYSSKTSEVSKSSLQSLLSMDDTILNDINLHISETEDVVINTRISQSNQVFESPIPKRRKSDPNQVKKCENLDLIELSLLNNSFLTVEELHYLQNESDNFDKNENPSEENHSFYGLPIKIKTLFKKHKGIEELYKWQEECLNLEAIKKRKNLIYALPTSGGKTLVAEILILKEIMCNRKNAILVLPYVAIVQEKVQTMAPFGLDLGFLIEEYAAGKGVYPVKKRRKKNSIYICTIEKALGVVNNLIELNRFDEIGIIVVDELHLLGEGGGRGATLEGLLTKVMFANENVHIVGMSATIGNSKEIAEFLKADLYENNFRPVKIQEYVKCNSEMCKIDLKSEEIFKEKKVLNYSYYTEEALQIDPDNIGGLVMEIVPNDSCLIFCSNRKSCENVAKLLTKVLFRSLQDHKKQEKIRLEKALCLEGVLCPILKRTIKYGVAYHHSGLTAEERKLIEDAFRDGIICVICCTSTLAAGVNLPARRVILRSPYIGNELLNTSKYKQMIGRAGRAGMGEIGESILICRDIDIPKVRSIVTSKIEDVLSSLYKEEDRGIFNLIMSSVLLSIAITRIDLHKLTARTLLSVQQNRLGLKVKEVTDKAISALIKKGVLKVKEKIEADNDSKDITVIIPSQDHVSTSRSEEVKKVVINPDTELELSLLGRAAMKACIDLQVSQTLYDDLKQAQKHLVLIDNLHLLYLITPYDLTNMVDPSGSVYYDVVIELMPQQMEIARLIGITEATVCRMRSGIMPKDVPERVVKRFYITLMLQELWNGKKVFDVAEKYQVNRGTIQFLLSSASSFTASVVRFCEVLSEFWAFKDIFTTFGKRLQCCSALELEPLMELPNVKMGRARQFYKAGFKTLASIANSTSIQLTEQIDNLSRKTAEQIIAAAKLIIFEKVVYMRDETENVLEGLKLERGINLSFPLVNF